MHISKIKVGHSYQDNWGSIRKVLAFGAEYKLYHGEIEEDNLRYLQMRKVKGPNIEGREYNCTRQAFASWAKYER